MGMVIDAFSHVLPNSFAEALMQAHPTDELRNLLKHNYLPDMETRARVLDKLGIQRQAITLARPTTWVGMAPELVPKMTRLANDAVARDATLFPDRFLAVGTLLFPTEEYLPEFDRCVNELGMVGIQIFTNIGGRPLDDPEFRPFFAHANATRTPIWLHPQLAKGWPPDYALDKSLGWPFETSIALSRLVFSGMMEQYPDLVIIAHHMGGMIPFFSGRLQGFYEIRDTFPGTRLATLPRDPLEYFQRFYVDTVLAGAVHALECGYKFFSAGHVVMATDYPYGPDRGEAWARGQPELLDQIAGLTRAEKDMILGGNLLRLINRQ
jgi:aminocarboxymuconate-semialdehyde decarboxylase